MNANENNFPGGNDMMEERLWEYIDGISAGEEKSVISQLIETNAEWKAKYRELMELHALVQSSELDEPSLRFTKNVMEQVAKLHIAPATRNYINKNIIRGLAIFFLTMILCFIVYGFGQIDWSSGSGDSKLPVDFTRIDYSRIFNNPYVNILMMINLVLGLFLLDRYLASKRSKYMEEA